MPPASKRGLFITFEGLDGSGKTTQIQRLVSWLRAQEVKPVVTRQPGGTETGDRIRALLLDSKSAGISANTELALMFADRAQAMQQIIAPALSDGQLVICDRFTDSTEAYQGGGRQLGSAVVLELHKLLCHNLQPDLTILLLPNLASSLARARKRNDKQIATSGADENRFETEADAFFRRVYDHYRKIAAREPVRVVTIEGDLTVEEVHQKVINTVEAKLKASTLS